MVLMAIVLYGCTSSPTPDPSIAWSDDFEDGNTEGWERYQNVNISVNEGVLTSGANSGAIWHESSVSNGTWSFDVFIPEKNGKTNGISFIASQLDTEGGTSIWVLLENQSSTLLELGYWTGVSDSETTADSVTIKENEKISGWHHIDITKENNGTTKVYFDGEMYLDTIIDLPYQSDAFLYEFYAEGPILDNVVVRNQVIDIQPAE